MKHSLVKSVGTAATAARPSYGLFYFLGFLLAASLLGNLILYCQFAMADEASAAYARDYLALKDKNDALYRGLEAQRLDQQELIDDEAHALQVTGPESGRAVMECVENPQGLFITPWALKSHWELKLHNAGPFPNAHGTWFGPGDACRIDRDSYLQVRAWEDVYVLQPWTPPGTETEWWACPDQAFHFVSKRNEVVWHAVFRACLSQVKAREYGLDRSAAEGISLESLNH